MVVWIYWLRLLGIVGVLKGLKRGLAGAVGGLMKVSIVSGGAVGRIMGSVRHTLVRSSIGVGLILSLSGGVRGESLRRGPPGKVAPERRIVAVVCRRVMGLLNDRAINLSVGREPCGVLFLNLRNDNGAAAVNGLYEFLRGGNFGPTIMYASA